MKRGFWDKLRRPIMGLAPMANVTDAAFRKIIAKFGKPDVFYTEFVSADGLASVGREKLLVDFRYDETQRPIVAQIFGARPENIFKAARLVSELKFDGIDINMGCPDRAVLKQGAGGALIKQPKLAQEIIQAAKEGASGLPVSVKTRIGYGKLVIDEWFSVLAEQGLAAIIVHLRTVKEMSKVPAHWELMPRIVETISSAARNRSQEGSLPRIKCGVEMDSRPLILGNGDVMSVAEAKEKCEQTGADGVMLGRAIFGNPWLFAKDEIASSPGSESGLLANAHLRAIAKQSNPSLQEKLAVMLEHTQLFEQMFQGIKNFDIMKKHYKAYITGFEGAKELRTELMNAKNATEVYKILKQHYPEIVFESARPMKSAVAV